VPPVGLYHAEAVQSAKAVPTAPPPDISPGPTTAVVHQVHSTDSDRTLAIVLASAALGIALCGSAYAVIRVTRMQRRVLSSN
jgi:small neutral amino acid transporter SnatA (MarC family)